MNLKTKIGLVGIGGEGRIGRAKGKVFCFMGLHPRD